ncbi:hypothetical protein HMSSN036_91480 [Paenibacillus macerans]|nr:hypothetical protein HMSSN036_91480 [Paenibacillus macerans]
MRNISDIIEKYLKSILHESPEGTIEIQRNDLADQFPACRRRSIT